MLDSLGSSYFEDESELSSAIFDFVSLKWLDMLTPLHQKFKHSKNYLMTYNMLSLEVKQYVVFQKARLVPVCDSDL